VDLYSEHLKIIRTGGCLKPFPGGEKMIPYAKLSGVRFKPPGALAGFVQFIFSGSLESKGNTFQAGENENTVFFSRKEAATFEYVRDFVQDRILHPASTAPPAQSRADAADSLAYLEKLASLRDQGIVTDEEFEAKKRQILG
jgi:hypothetical protein